MHSLVKSLYLRLRFSPHTPEFMRALLIAIRNRIMALNPPIGEEAHIEPAIMFYIKWIGPKISLMFDVGAHTGQFARSAMSVLPPHVKLVLFEADPRHLLILKSLKKAYPAIGKIVPKAVYHTSGKTLRFLQGLGPDIQASHLLTNGESASGINVLTVALDDFIKATSLRPELIKIDVEGNEYDVMNGAAHYLREYQPAIIFEDNDLRAVHFMQSLGYLVINTSTALIFDPAEENPDQCIFNFFAYHLDQALRFGIEPLKRILLTSGALGDFRAAEHSHDGFYTSVSFSYPTQQKFLLELVFAQQLLGDLKIEYRVDGKAIGHYGGDVNTILKSYTSCPLYVPAGSHFQFCLYTQVELGLTDNMLNIYSL